MGAFQSVPDEVLLNKVCELIGESGSTNSYHVKKLLALRATCKSGHELVRRIIASKAICLHLDSLCLTRNLRQLLVLLVEFLPKSEIVLASLVEL